MIEHLESLLPLVIICCIGFLVWHKRRKSPPIDKRHIDIDGNEWVSVDLGSGDGGHSGGDGGHGGGDGGGGGGH